MIGCVDPSGQGSKLFDGVHARCSRADLGPLGQALRALVPRGMLSLLSRRRLEIKLDAVPCNRGQSLRMGGWGSRVNTIWYFSYLDNYLPRLLSFDLPSSLLHTHLISGGVPRPESQNPSHPWVRDVVGVSLGSFPPGWLHDPPATRSKPEPSPEYEGWCRWQGTGAEERRRHRPCCERCLFGAKHHELHHRSETGAPSVGCMRRAR